MKTICLRTAMVLAMAGLGGCSGSDVSQVAELPSQETLAAATTSLTPVTNPGAAADPETTTNEPSNEIEPFRNPFAPPNEPPPPPVVEEPEPEPEAAPEPAPEIRQPGTPPKIRLLGFMNTGEPKVLISYRNELETLAIGDTVEDMKVVAIESPDLTLLFEEREIKLGLFDQAWQHEGSPVSADSNSRTKARPRATSPPRNTSTSPSSGTTAGGIPGFAPNAGKPPGFQPQTPTPPGTGTGSTPQAPIGNPPPSLPGLGGETSGGDGEIPFLLRLDANVGDQRGPGDLPPVPSGR